MSTSLLGGMEPEVEMKYSVNPRLEYKTVKAVNGPLVILEDVKVSFEGVRLCLSGVCTVPC